MSEKNFRLITVIEGMGIPLRGNDIDTDRIIPSRFMKCVTFDGLGEYVFYDQRFDDKKNLKEHPFNDQKYKNGSILIVNKNFGCGSSREHAPQSLLKFGIKAIIGESFAEIFAGNCMALGIPTVTASEDDVEDLMTAVEEILDTMITIDLNKKTVKYNNTLFHVNIPESSRLSLVKGTWDTIALLLDNRAEIEKTADKIPYLSWEKENETQ